MASPEWANRGPSPGFGAPSAFALPPNKRPRIDGSSQPGSPYPGSPYANSPTNANTPPAASPPQAGQTSNIPTPTSVYTNGHVLNLPDPRSNTGSPVPAPQTPQTSYTNATLVPVQNPAQPTGTMGPPQRPADRPTKDYEYDVTDSLAGTGIDLRAEEQYMSDLYANSFESGADARTGFARYPPGAKSTLYGAGPANQPAQTEADSDQDRFAAQAAEQAWNESSMRLGVSKTQEMNDPFLSVANLHKMADKVTKEHGLELNLDSRATASGAGRIRFAEPVVNVTVKTQPGSDAAMVVTASSSVPHEAYLVDQLALLSIATKQRLRDLVQDAGFIASTRQTTSHGEFPEEWNDAAAPMNVDPIGQSAEALDAAMDEILSNGTAPLKRSSDAAVLENGTKPRKMAKISSYMAVTMRDLARQERDWEEARQRRRQKRRDNAGEPAATPTRAGSVAPGTPGTIAPDPEKSISKKEQKKNQAAKAAEAHSHANQNMTSSMFAGFGGKGGLFGKKKTGRTYDWMNVGRGGSGASTPTKMGPGGGKTPAGTPVPGATGGPVLTSEGRARLGTWREDREKGKGIQLRDWVVALERDGREARALQHAYAYLDDSGPR